MKTYARALSFFLAAIIAWSPAVLTAKADGPRIQLAILLDTSSSMDGLIDQAKSQLWKIVNEMAQARRDGKVPRLEVSLYEYGKSSIPSGEGYLRMVVPFTTDLDRLSEDLFALTTNGGDEYCGRVIQAATKGLAWSGEPADLKVIFIAGNEPFSQGEVDFRVAVKAAAAKNIIVNTIYCGDYDEGVQTHWRDGALLAQGRYMHINHNERVAYIAAPQDAEISQLGNELNLTYIPYGMRGEEKKERQAMQDKNAAGMSEESVIQRSVAKASKLYSNAGWDLVDAVRDGKVKAESLKKEELPPQMQKMSPAERKSYIDAQTKKRAELQTRISKLNQERRVFIENETKKLAGKNTLDAAIIKTVREQAGGKNFRFE
ncbi:MAG: VWA domain-containing protein [Spirochaetes bacterium]|nr:VWA domain-containing protein [Spirochaetota bacterium]